MVGSPESPELHSEELDDHLDQLALDYASQHGYTGGPDLDEYFSKKTKKKGGKKGQDTQSDATREAKKAENIRNREIKQLENGEMARFLKSRIKELSPQEWAIYSTWLLPELNNQNKKRAPKIDIKGNPIELPPYSQNELRVTTTTSSVGAGGQATNTGNVAVQIIHLPTKEIANGDQGRSQDHNQEIAETKLKSLLTTHISYWKHLIRLYRKIKNLPFSPEFQTEDLHNLALHWDIKFDQNK